MAEEAAGYVVQSAGNRFLSRTMRFVKHRDKKDVHGLQRAWVHSLAALQGGGDWTIQAKRVYPAKYDSGLEQTEILGGPTWFDEFAAKEMQPKQV